MLGNSHCGSGGFCRARAARRGYGQNRNESDVGGRKNCSAAATAIDGGDGGRCTRVESSTKSRKVVKARAREHRKNPKIGEREPTQIHVLGAGHHPIQADTGGTSAKPTGPDEEDTVINPRG